MNYHRQIAHKLGQTAAETARLVSSTQGQHMSVAGISTDPLQVRWLSTLCGLAPDWPLPYLASSLLSGGDQAQIFSYIAHWARHPEAGSSFERAVGHLPDIPDKQLAAALHDRGYDGLLYFEDKEIVGHLFFQRHDSEVHAFSAWLTERRRGEDLTAVTFFDLLACASASAGIKRTRFGRGQVATRLLSPLERAGASLRWRVRTGGWVDFSREEL